MSASARTDRTRAPSTVIPVEARRSSAIKPAVTTCRSAPPKVTACSSVTFAIASMTCPVASSVRSCATCSSGVPVHVPVSGSMAKSSRRATSAGSAKWKLTVTCTVTS